MPEIEEPTMKPYDDEAYGVIAMAAYQPNYALFLTQLRSIQAQTHKNFRCLISVDGDPGPVIDFVQKNLDDNRFQVLGFGQRLGFYRNFERVLLHVPAAAQWVALSDQDDYWYPEKIEKLIPHLGQNLLVSAQARVVEAGTGRVISESTNRKNVPLSDLVVQNQVTGGQTIFRRELLALALPFPRLETSTQVHDHWLAVCASATGSLVILDDIVQDYVQHDGNVLGEVGGGFNPLRSVQRVVEIADRFEEGHSVRQVLRACRTMSYGWREAMVDALQARLVDKGADFSQAYNAFSSEKKWGRTISALASGVLRGNIALSCLAEYIAGAPGEIFHGAKTK